MPRTTGRTHSRHLLAKIAITASLAVMPVGLVAVPAAAHPAPVPASQRWSHDCDHSGPWQWQQNRGQWEWNNCNYNRGHWVWVRDYDHHHHDAWRWQYNNWDRHDNWYPTAPPPRGGIPLFGSS